MLKHYLLFTSEYFFNFKVLDLRKQIFVTGECTSRAFVRSTKSRQSWPTLWYVISYDKPVTAGAVCFYCWPMPCLICLPELSGIDAPCPCIILHKLCNPGVWHLFSLDKTAVFWFLHSDDRFLWNLVFDAFPRGRQINSSILKTHQGLCKKCMRDYNALAAYLVIPALFSADLQLIGIFWTFTKKNFFDWTNKI